MQNFQSSEPIVAQLLEIDTKLAAQEAELILQLQSIQEKRHSLKNVVSLFPSIETTALIPVATLTPVVKDVVKLPAQENTTLELDEVTTEITESAPQSSKQRGKKNLTPNSDKPSKKSAPAKETVKEAAIWQQYLQDEFITDSLAVAVFEVMQQQPKQVLEITTILDTIFVAEIPKDVRSTARERVSNILSVGAKKGKWYRGKLGKCCYRNKSSSFYRRK